MSTLSPFHVSSTFLPNTTEMADAVGAMLVAEAEAEGDRPTACGPHRFRGSWAGKCSREIGFRILGVEADVPIDGTSYFAFDMGDAAHDIVQRALPIRYPGAEIEVPVSWRPKADLSCNLDGWIASLTTGVEIKTMKAFAFDIAVGNRTSYGPGGPKAEHILQSGLGTIAMGGDKLHLIYVSKEDGRMAEWRFGVDEPLSHLDGAIVTELVDAELQRFAGISKRIDNGELPRAVVPGHGLVIDPPAKGTKGQPWPCRFCPFQPTCKAIGPDIISVERVHARQNMNRSNA